MPECQLNHTYVIGQPDGRGGFDLERTISLSEVTPGRWFIVITKDVTTTPVEECSYEITDRTVGMKLNSSNPDALELVSPSSGKVASSHFDFNLSAQAPSIAIDTKMDGPSATIHQVTITRVIGVSDVVLIEILLSHGLNIVHDSSTNKITIEVWEP